MAKASRTPTREERELWRQVTGDVNPLGARRAALPLEPDTESHPPPAIRRTTPVKPSASKTLPHLTEGDTPGVDRRTGDRLRRGQLSVAARLDLHGLTQDEAHAALSRFIFRSYDAAHRMVLVITGKGARPAAGNSGGVLKNAVPRWLNEPALRMRILSFTYAQPRDGGSGALYVLLKRRR